MHSELSEALEAYREYGNTTNAWMELVDEDSDDRIPVGVGHELADVVIRVADMAEWYGVDLQWAYDIALGAATQDEPDGFGDWITTLHQTLSTAWIWSSPPKAKLFSTQVVPLGALVCGVCLMAGHYGIDLDAAIEATMEYNRGRSYRHGGKVL